MRALVGKVAMDDPASCPDYYRDASVGAAIEGTMALIEYVRGHTENRDGLVLPAITPRFIPSCTDPLLEGLGALAQSSGCHVQTHCSESDWEHGAVLARYGRSDAESLDGFGLMTRRTVLAHSNFVSDGDMDLIGARGAGIAHCPLSNAYFSNAVFPLRRAIEKGLHVGLGTDISGGPSASLLENCRMAIAASRMLEDGVDARLPPEGRGQADSRIDWKTAFHLATAGGAKALDLPIGRFEPGNYFDAIAVDTEAPDGTVRLFDDRSRGGAAEDHLHGLEAEHRRCLGGGPPRRRTSSVERGNPRHDDETVDAADPPHPAAERRILIVLDAEIAAERDGRKEGDVGKRRMVACETRSPPRARAGSCGRP